MATDDQVFRLTWVFDGQQFSGPFNAATANTLAQLSKVENANVRLTQVSVQEIKKQVDAQTQGAAAIAAATQRRAASTAAANATAIFPPATDRIVTSVSTRQLASAERLVNPLQATITRIQRAISTLETELQKAVPGTEQFDRVISGLVEAHKKLASAQELVAYTTGVSNDNLSKLEQAAQSLKDRIDPLGASYRDFTESLATADTLLANNKITKGEFSDAVQFARQDFANAAASIRKEAEATYNALVASSERLRASLLGQASSTGAIVGRPGEQELAASTTRTGQLQAAITTGTPVNQQALQNAKALADENNRLAAEQEAANASARKLRDVLDPLGAAQRSLSDTMMGYVRLLGLGAIGTDEYTAAQKRLHDTTQARIADLTGQAALEKALREFQVARGPNAAPVQTPQVTQANALISNVQANVAAGKPFDPVMAQEAKDLAVEITRVAEATRGFRNELNPTIALSNELNDKLSLIARSGLDDVDKIELRKRAYDSFRQSLAGLSAGADVAYKKLQEVSDSFQKAQSSNRTIAGPPAPTAQITEANTLQAQLRASVATGQPVDPATLQRVEELTNELKRMTVAENDAAVSAQKLRDELDPIGAATRNATEEIAKYQALVGNTITQDEFLAKEKQINDALSAKKADLSGASIARDDYDRLSKAAETYRERLNPLLSAQRQYTEEIAKLNEFVSVGLIDQKEASATVDRYTASLQKVDAALVRVNAQNLNTQQIGKQFKPILQQAESDFTHFASTTTHAFGLNRIGFLQLQASGVNAFQSLAAGISPLRTAETEGAQVVGALIQGTNLTLRQFVLYASTLGAVTAAFVAFGVAVAGAAARATEIRQLNVALATFHQGSTTTAEDLIKIQKEFAKTGESTTTLKTAIAELARNPNINISATGNILEQARNIGAAFGTDIAGGLKELTTALDGGVQGIIDLGFHLGVLTGDQAAEIAILERTKGAQAAIKQAYTEITAALKPYTEAEGKAQELTRALTGVWNEFIDSIKESEPVQNALKYVQELISQINKLKNDLNAQNKGTGGTTQSTDIFSGVLHGATIGGLAGAGIGAGVTAPSIIGTPLGFIAGGAAGTILGGIAGGFTAAGLNRIGPLGSQAGQYPTTAPTITSYSTGVTTDASGRAGVSASAANANNSIVTLGTGIRNVNENLSRFNTTITTSISGEQKYYQVETNNFSTETKLLDDLKATFDKLNTSGGTLATTFANIKAPQMVGGLETGGAIGGGAGVATFGNAFKDALARIESGGKNISQGIFDINSAKGTPGEGYFQITGPTVRQYSGGQYGSAFQLNAQGQSNLVDSIPFNRFGARTQQLMQQQFGPFDINKTVGELSQITSGTKAYTEAVKTSSAAAGPAAADSKQYAAAIEQQKLALFDTTKQFEVITPFLRQFGSEGEANTARALKALEVSKATHDADLAAAAGKEASTEVIKRATAARDKEISTATLEITTTVDTTRAFKEGLIPGYQAQAEAQARLANLQEPLINVQQRTNQELQKAGTSAILSSQQQIAATTPLLTRQEALAKAALRGAAAEHEQTLVNEANAQTFESISRAAAQYNQAQKSGTEVDKQRTAAALDQAKAQEKVALAQIRTADVARQITEVGHTLQQNRDQAQVLALQASLQGQTTEEIQRQTVLLQTRQYISEHLNNISEKYKQSVIDSVTQVQNLTVALAETQRQQERLNQLFQNIGETFSSTLGQAIQDAFDGTKITDWGTRIRQVISQIMADIVQFSFIRPVIGTALQAIGLAQAGQNFGSIGSLVGGIGGATATANTVSALTGATIVGNNGSVLGSLGNLGGVAATGTSLLGGGSIFGAGGFTSFLNSLGSRLGFAEPGSPFSATVAGPSVPGATTATTGAAQGGLFGTTTLGQLLGASALGFGAGSLLNALRGGNTVTGTVGSGFGAIGGAALGSILFPGLGTILGGLAGGAGGGLLGGLFGNNRPTNASTGANINLSTGAISGFQSSGNTTNDQTVNQITQSVSAFTQSIQQLTKGTATGALNVQAGTRDGIKINFAGSIGTFQSQAQDAATAINDIELKIAQGLTGVSTTLKTALGHITDPAQVQDVVTFAATYDDLAKASDSAFSSISADVKTVGPFAQALATLNTTFADLTDKANQFGLSLDPINAGLAEATKRLRDDFGVALDQALNTANNSDFLNQLTTVAQNFSSNVQERQAIGLGGDTTTLNKINQLEVAQAQSVLSALTTSQLKQVEDAFNTTNPEIAAMAKALLDAGISANTLTSSAQDATTALQNFVTGIKSVEDAVSALRTGPLSGQTPAQQVTNASTAFQAQFATVQAAGTKATGDQLTQLANLANTAVTTAQNIYGNAPQTADLRGQVLNALNSVLNVTGPSTAPSPAATTAAPTPGAAAQAAIQASPAVSSAQANAVLAALHAAGVPGFAVGTIDTNILSTHVAAPSFVSSIFNTLPNFAHGTTSSISTTSNDRNQNQIHNNREFNIKNVNSTMSSYADGIVNYDHRQFATGTNVAVSQTQHKTTPSGPILVGERGPEWMLPAHNDKWIQVGTKGPEIIHQPGGAIILPYPQRPIPKFAGGTDNSIESLAGKVPGIGSAISQASGGPSILEAVGGGLGISGDTLSALGSVVGVAGPLIGGIIGIATGANPASTGLGVAGSLLGLAVAGPIGGIIGGLAGLIGIGPKPSNKSSGDVVDLATGAISDWKSAGDKKADQTVQQISAGISAITTTFQKATGGTITGIVNVQDGNRDGIKTSYAGTLGNIDAKWGSVTDAIGQFGLAIAHNLSGIDPAVAGQLSAVTDPNALIPTIQQATGKSIDLLTGTVTDNLVAAAPTDTAVATANSATAATVTTPKVPSLKEEYDSIVGNNQTDYNNDAGFHNKISLVNVLSGYAALPKATRDSYDITVGRDIDKYNNTPTGLGNKLSLIYSLNPSFTANANPTMDNLMTKYNALPITANFVAGTINPDHISMMSSNDNTFAGGTSMSSLSSASSLSSSSSISSMSSASSPSSSTSYETTTHDRRQYADGTGTYMSSNIVNHNGRTRVESLSSHITQQQFAVGGHGTPPGKILVGEKGPEWMYQGGSPSSLSETRFTNNISSISNHPMYAAARMIPDIRGWALVGVHGPEVIDQRGGATILPFPKTPWEGAGRAFADGVGDLPEVAFASPTVPALGPSASHPIMRENAALLDKLDRLNNEVVALRRVTQGVGQDTSEKAKTGNQHLEQINSKISPNISSPRRQKFG